MPNLKLNNESKIHNISPITKKKLLIHSLVNFNGFKKELVEEGLVQEELVMEKAQSCQPPKTVCQEVLIKMVALVLLLELPVERLVLLEWVPVLALALAWKVLVVWVLVWIGQVLLVLEVPQELLDLMRRKKLTQHLLEIVVVTILQQYLKEKEQRK